MIREVSQVNSYHQYCKAVSSQTIKGEVKSVGQGYLVEICALFIWCHCNCLIICTCTHYIVITIPCEGSLSLFPACNLNRTMKVKWTMLKKAHTDTDLLYPLLSDTDSPGKMYLVCFLCHFYSSLLQIALFSVMTDINRGIIVQIFNFQWILGGIL